MWLPIYKGSGVHIEKYDKNDSLQYAIQNGIIDLAYVQEQIEMKKRQDILSKHCYKIWQGKDGKWYTYIQNEDNTRKLIKRTSKKAIEDYVVSLYKKNEDAQKTFLDMYYKWRKTQDIMVSYNTVAKYNTDFKRYFEDNKDFVQKNISCITEDDIKTFLVLTIKSKKLCKKACKTLFGYINNTFNCAKINKIIESNPMDFLTLKNFYKFCVEQERNPDKILVSDTDMKKLYEQFYDDYNKKPTYIPTYAVHLASLTGMRVGELSALRWDCITDNYIIINKSEKYDKINKVYYIDSTKNEKSRIFPITPEIMEILHNVKKAELRSGNFCEWVFANENGRVHAPVISSCMKNKCRQADITEKGIHALRRTINSKMRCNGVSAVIAASLLGHTEEVNEKHYTFDITSINKKADIVSKIDKQISAL